MRPLTLPGSRSGRMSAWSGALALGLAAGLSACQDAALTPPAAPPLPPSPPANIQKALETAFVVFATKDFEIAEIGVPVEAPVTVGSRASPQTMRSESPEIVSVEPDGRLLAHGSGQTRIVARSGGPPLEVRVRPASPASRERAAPAPAAGADGVTVMPARATLKLGDVMAFQVHTQRGPVPATWISSDERTIAHLQDQVFQGLKVGRAQVCARALGRRACSMVEVIP